jgi:hypothetical protein
MHQKDRSERLSRDKLISIIMARDCVQGAAFAAGDIRVRKHCRIAGSMR